jgi:Xaa-Pro dipeptidase
LNSNKVPAIVLPELELAKVDNLPYPIQIYTYGENPVEWIHAFEKAASLIKSDTNLLGVEPKWMRFLELKLIEKAFPGILIESAESVTASLRMKKDDLEIDYMQMAVDIAQQALENILPKIKPGIKELDIASELTIQLFQHGSNPKLPFSPIVSSGPNSANPHASPSDREIRHGDLLVIDYGANVKGYFSDITRTFAIGEVDSEYKKIARIVLEANQAGHEMVKPGVKARSIDLAARQVIEDAGYGEYFIHRTGHGLGLEGHENPYIHKDNDIILEEGMTFTIEPGIYLPGRNGVRIEDDVLVTKDGIRSFTTLSRELITLY